FTLCLLLMLLRSPRSSFLPYTTLFRSQQLFQPAVLQFEILEPFGIRHGHATELGAPSVERGITEAMPPAQLLHRHTGLRLLQKVENLFFRKTLFHCRLLLGKRTLLSSAWY